MTASRQRLVSAIRGIAKTDPDLANAIAKTYNKGGHHGSSASASSSGEESRICCDGSTGAVNPGTNQRNPDDEDAGQDGLDPDDPANLDMGGGSLTGLTDCATGEPICFDGADCIPPDGWPDCRTPPPDSSWQEGHYYIHEVTKNGDTISQKNVAGIIVSPCPGSCCCPKTIYSSITCSSNCGGGPDSYSASTSGPFECPAEPTGDLSEICSLTEAPPEKGRLFFPADECINLSIQSGTIVGSKYDPENDGTYNTPMAELTLCDEFGNQVNIKPSADGGWKSINGTTGEDGYLYNAQGEQIAHIDGNEYNDPLI